MDLKEELVTRLGDGPGHRPVAERLAAGKRAVRRRRVAAGAVALAVAAIAGGSAVGLANTGADRATPDRAPIASQSTAPEPTAPPTTITVGGIRFEAGAGLENEIPVNPHLDCRDGKSGAACNVQPPLDFDQDGRLFRRDVTVLVHRLATGKGPEMGGPVGGIWVLAEVTDHGRRYRLYQRRLANGSGNGNWGEFGDQELSAWVQQMRANGWPTSGAPE